MSSVDLDLPRKHRPASDIMLGQAARSGGPETGQEGCMGFCTQFLIVSSTLLIIITFPISVWFCLQVVTEYQRAVVFRMGRLKSGSALGPGLIFVNPCIDQFVKIDLRVASFDVPPQEILTKDSVTIKVDAIMYYRIYDPTMSVVNVHNVHRSTQMLASSSLRNTLGTKNMSEILSQKEKISADMQVNLDEATDPWGVKVERVEVKDVRLPLEMQRSMAAEAEASREATAKLIAAEGEQKAAKALRAAADEIYKSPAAMQLRYLQTLNVISAEKNSTIIFPLPMELLRAMSRQ